MKKYLGVVFLFLYGSTIRSMTSEPPSIPPSHRGEHDNSSATCASAPVTATQYQNLSQLPSPRDTTAGTAPAQTLLPQLQTGRLHCRGDQVLRETRAHPTIEIWRTIQTIVAQLPPDVSTEQAVYRSINNSSNRRNAFRELAAILSSSPNLSDPNDVRNLIHRTKDPLLMSPALYGVSALARLAAQHLLSHASNGKLPGQITESMAAVLIDTAIVSSSSNGGSILENGLRVGTRETCIGACNYVVREYLPDQAYEVIEDVVNSQWWALPLLSACKRVGGDFIVGLLWDRFSGTN